MCISSFSYRSWKLTSEFYYVPLTLCWMSRRWPLYLPSSVQCPSYLWASSLAPSTWSVCLPLCSCLGNSFVTGCIWWTVYYYSVNLCESLLSGMGHEWKEISDTFPFLLGTEAWTCWLWFERLVLCRKASVYLDRDFVKADCVARRVCHDAVQR